MKRFLGMVRRNIVGPAGIRLQVRAKKRTDELDELLNREVEEKFSEWAQPENCSASGKYSWVDAQAYAIGTMARDGEFLCRFIEADNPFGFSLKFYDTAYLDETYNEVLPNGNRVLMSVEVDRYDRPLAYYFTTPRHELYPAGYGRVTMERVRVPASEVIHGFLPFDDDGQIRGVPWAHAAMWELRQLGQFQEAELINAHWSACKMGFYVPPANDEGAGVPDTPEEEAARPPLAGAPEPGLLQELPPGYEFQTFDPQHPNNNFDPFTSSVLRGAAAGLDVSYFALANDLKAVNYSSARVGLLDDRDAYRTIQNFLTAHFCRRVYRAWLKRAILTGALVGVLPSDYDRLKNPDFQPRGWAWVDPLKDIAAAVMAINNGLTTRSQVIAEGGGDFEDVAKRLSEEQELLVKLKVLLKGDNLQTLIDLLQKTADERD
jgi:lambda family phage portal protein